MKREILNPFTDIKQIILKYLPYIFLFFAVFLVYGKTIGHDITGLDDISLIHGNAVSYSSKTQLKNIFTNNVLFGGHTVYYRPLLTLSFALEHKLAGTSPHFAHLTNILLHILSCFIVFFFFKRYLMSETAAFIAALFFAVHPANLYTVTWIPGRNDSLFLIFLLLSLIFFIEYLNKKKLIFIILHFIFFAFLLFTKESAIVMPVIFILYLLTHKEKDKKFFRFFIYISIVWVIQISFFIIIQKNAVPNMSFIQYALKCFYPSNISMFFEYYASMIFLTVPFGINIAAKSFILGSIAIAFIFYIAFCCGKDKLKMFFYFILPFLLIAATMPGGRIWYQGNRMYLPLFAILAVCFICFDVFYTNNKKYRKQILALPAILLLLCAVITSAKSELFKNGMLFWSAVYSDSKNPSIVIQNLYADALLKFGYPDKALPAIEKAMAGSEKVDMSTVYNLANYYLIVGDYEKAGSYFEALAKNPMLADEETYANLFICGKFLNNEEAAKFYYEKTLQKFNNSLEKTNAFITELMQKLQLTQETYEKRKTLK
ncbi:MAG: tetratricopeptide repeat protein [Endomicrobia bacterium]|nr:tetratricopeptide repeat protein [Endomicrobiia bacterium]